jgi:hypothetical protein
VLLKDVVHQRELVPIVDVLGLPCLDLIAHGWDSAAPRPVLKVTHGVNFGR